MGFWNVWFRDKAEVAFPTCEISVQRLRDHRLLGPEQTFFQRMRVSLKFREQDRILLKQRSRVDWPVD